MEVPDWLTIDNIFHPRLIDYFSDWETHGIFQTPALQTMPWVNDNTFPIVPAVLDLVYYANRSGDKLPSPLVKRLAESNPDNELSSTQVNTLGQAVVNIYGAMFVKQWATLKTQYNPMENYRMTEVETTEDENTHGHTLTITDNLNHRKTGSTSKTQGQSDSITEVRTPNTQESTEISVAGFNSSDMSDQSAQIRTETGSERTTTQRTTQGTNSETYNITNNDSGTRTHANSGTDTKEGERNLTRYGNNGTTTNQQLLQQERDLWQWNFVEQVVFPAVDKILCALTY